MCHAPIVIPAIGGERGRECEATTRAMVEAAEVLAAAAPETVVVLSPHAPRSRTAFCWKSEGRWVGTFSAFGRADLGMTFEADLQAAHALSRAALTRGIPLEPSVQDPMDHGALVPLWFVREAGCMAKVLVLGFPWDSDTPLLEGFSAALGEAMAGLDPSKGLQTTVVWLTSKAGEAIWSSVYGAVQALLAYGVRFFARLDEETP